jgi:hypothetical protein
MAKRRRLAQRLKCDDLMRCYAFLAYNLSKEAVRAINSIEK